MIRWPLVPPKHSILNTSCWQNISVTHVVANGNSLLVLSQQGMDELELIVTAEEIELEHNVWDFTDLTMIFGSFLLNIDE